MEQFNRLEQFVSDLLGPFAPRLIGAATIAVTAWIVARIAGAAAGRLAQARALDEKMQSPGFSQLLGNIAYWLVWLFALPALLGALQLDGLLVPVSAMLSKMLGFLPNLMGAAIVFSIGFLVARIVRQVLTGLLTAAGSERFAARIGMAPALGKNTLAGMLASIVFVLILLPTLAAALQALALDAVTTPVSHLLDTVIGLIPKLTAAVVVVAVAAVIGRAAATIVTTLLTGLGFDRLPQWLGWSGELSAGGRSASDLAGSVVMATALLLAATQACEIIGFASLTEAVATLGAVLARVAAALVVLGVGLWLATVAAGLIRSGARANGPALALAARAAIVFFAGALALRQAGLPAEIVTIAFGAVVGALAIGVAIAVGVGGRHVAGRLLEALVASLAAGRVAGPVDGSARPVDARKP